MLVKAATLVVLLSGVTALVAGPGSQAGLWHYRTGFQIVRWAVYLGAPGGAIALIGAALAAGAKRHRAAIAGVVVAAVAGALIWPTWQLQRTASEVPRIHDITTDTENPPQFVALFALRQKTQNGPEYAGDKVAREQKAAYPDIQPVMLTEPPAAAFERALAAARSMGWEIVAAAAPEGRIEATATTRWFRFKDDIVIRIAPHASGSRIDVRSKSRIGRSDLGTNAKRIRAYVHALSSTR
jgi:uncharacterized protein (DUF1499 family)